MKVECSLGDVVDRMTILTIKAERIADPGKLANVRAELAALAEGWAAEGHAPADTLDLWAPLLSVNTRLWDVEDALREHERAGRFDARFVELARSVYVLNDERAALKRRLNVELGSALVEEKSYAPYR